MVELLLPKNSKVVKGDNYTEKGSKKSLKTFLIYRYDPDKSEQPRIDRYDVDLSNTGPCITEIYIISIYSWLLRFIWIIPINQKSF